MADDEAFIAAIRGGGDLPRPAYADSLQAQGDVRRAEYLRAEAAWAAGPTPAAQAGLRQMAADLEPVWVARVSRPPLGVCCDRVRFRDFDLDHPRPKVTAAELDRLERRFEVTLPPDPRPFMMNTNGGVPDPSRPELIDPVAPGLGKRIGVFNSLHRRPAGMAPDERWESDPGSSSSRDHRDWDFVNHLHYYERERLAEPGNSQFGLYWKGSPQSATVQVAAAGDWVDMTAGTWTPFDIAYLSYNLGVNGEACGKVYQPEPNNLYHPRQADHRCPQVAGSFAELLASLTDNDPEQVRAVRADDRAALEHWLEVTEGMEPAGWEGRLGPVRQQSLSSLLTHSVRLGKAWALEVVLARRATPTLADRELAEQLGDPEVIRLLRLAR